MFVLGQVGVVAYDAATGAQLWAKSPYQRPTNDGFGQLVVSLQRGEDEGARVARVIGEDPGRRNDEDPPQ